MKIIEKYFPQIPRENKINLLITLSSQFNEILINLHFVLANKDWVCDGGEMKSVILGDKKVYLIDVMAFNYTFRRYEMILIYRVLLKGPGKCAINFLEMRAFSGVINRCFVHTFSVELGFRNVTCTLS